MQTLLEANRAEAKREEEEREEPPERQARLSCFISIGFLQYKSTTFTCFTGTKVQKLTGRKALAER